MEINRSSGAVRRVAHVHRGSRLCRRPLVVAIEDLHWSSDRLPRPSRVRTPAAWRHTCLDDRPGSGRSFWIGAQRGAAGGAITSPSRWSPLDDSATGRARADAWRRAPRRSALVEAVVATGGGQPVLRRRDRASAVLERVKSFDHPAEVKLGLCATAGHRAGHGPRPSRRAASGISAKCSRSGRYSGALSVRREWLR